MSSEDRYAYCKVFVLADTDDKGLLEVIQSALPGTVDGETLNALAVTIEVRWNEEFDADRATDFIYWPLILDIDANDQFDGKDVVDAVAKLLGGLWLAGFDAIAACRFEEELPFAGGKARPRS